MKRSANARQSGAAPRAARAPAKPHAPVTEKTPRGGARSQQTRMGSRLRAWGRHHRAMALDSLFRLVRYPLGNLLTMLAIAIALVLPAALWLTLDSAKLLDAELDESASLTVYLDMGIDAAQAARIEEAVSADGGVAQTRMISPEQGMADFQQSLGIDDTLAGLDDNPLPASIVISPQDVEPAAMAELAERLEGVTGIDEVRVDLAWVERLRHLAALGRRVALALACRLDQALWLLDEPFAGLDQATVDSLADLFTAHLQQGGGLVFSSHDRSLPGARVLQLRPAVDQHQQGEHSAAAERSEADRRV